MTNKFTLRQPTANDGMDIHKLIADCPPLDTNSSYCNFLQSSHFAQTAIVATHNDQIVGSVSGYRLPDQPNILFIWQVAVSETARGEGLASQMLTQLLTRLQSSGVDTLHTTITKSNSASWSLFTSLAKTLNTSIEHSIWLERDQHFKGQHDSEYLVEIGPFSLIHTGNQS